MDTVARLRSIPLFAALTTAQLGILSRYVRTCHYPRGTTIFREGEDGAVLFVILQGSVRIYTLGTQGQEVTVAVFSGGDFFGELALLDGRPRSASAEAMRDTQALLLPRETFLQSVHDCPPIAATLLEALAWRLRRSTSHVGDLTSLTAAQRVMQQLLMLSAPGGSIRLTQEQLAQLLGTTRETVNRVLRQLREQGIVAIERSQVRVVSPAHLEQALAAA